MKKSNKNVQVVKVTNIKRNKTICYISLFFLVILLFLPKALRLFVADVEIIQEKIIEVLTCNKNNENISSTFLNGVPQNLQYKIAGDYTVTTNPDELNPMIYPDDVDSTLYPDENVVTQNEQVISPNPSVSNELIDVIRSYSTLDYKIDENVTTIRTEMSNLKNLAFYTNNLSTIDLQNSYFSSVGFTCNKSKLS